MRTCSTCAYSEPIAEGDDGLPRTECRRYPAQVFAIDGYASQAWPNVEHGDWCGEWRSLLPAPDDFEDLDVEDAAA